MFDNGKEKKQIFKSRFKNAITKNKKLFSFWGITFYKQTEYEVQVTKKKYTASQAEAEALNLAQSKIKLKLNDKERIIKQKVLNKTMKNSKMEIEIFVSVEEQIGESVNYEVPNEQESS